MRIMLHTEQFNQIMNTAKNIIRTNADREALRGVDPVRITNGTHNILCLPVRHPGNDW